MLMPWPLDSAGFLDHFVIADSRDIARHIARELFEDLKRRFGRFPAFEHFAATPVFRNEFENVEIGQRLAWRAMDLSREPDPSLGIDHRPFYFPPGTGR